MKCSPHCVVVLPKLTPSNKNKSYWDTQLGMSCTTSDWAMTTLLRQQWNMLKWALGTEAEILCPSGNKTVSFPEKCRPSDQKEPPPADPGCPTKDPHQEEQAKVELLLNSWRDPEACPFRGGKHNSLRWGGEKSIHCLNKNDTDLPGSVCKGRERFLICCF